MDDMLKAGLVIWLDVPNNIILSRVLNAKEERPLLKDKSEEALFQFINETVSARSEIYNKAHIHFENVSVNAEKMQNLIDQIKMASI